MLDGPRSILTTRVSGAIHAPVNKKTETGSRDPPRTITSWMIGRSIRSISSCRLVGIDRVDITRDIAGVNGGSRCAAGHAARSVRRPFVCRRAILRPPPGIREHPGGVNAGKTGSSGCLPGPPRRVGLVKTGPDPGRSPRGARRYPSIDGSEHGVTIGGQGGPAVLDDGRLVGGDLGLKCRVGGGIRGLQILEVRLDRADLAGRDAGCREGSRQVGRGIAAGVFRSDGPLGRKAFNWVGVSEENAFWMTA